MSFGYRNTFQLIDKGNIEVMGPAGLSFNLQAIAKNYSSFQSGFVSNYALTLMLGVLLVFLSFNSNLFGFDGSNGIIPILLFGYSIFCFLF